MVGLVTFGFLATGLGSGGRADLTVTYTPEDGGPQVSEQIVVEGVHCGDNGAHLTYGDAALGRAQVSARNDLPSDQAREDSSANITLRFGDDLQFLSLEPFTSDATGFRLEDHPGVVIYVGQDPGVLGERRHRQRLVADGPVLHPAPHGGCTRSQAGSTRAREGGVRGAAEAEGESRGRFPSSAGLGSGSSWHTGELCP